MVIISVIIGISSDANLQEVRRTCEQLGLTDVQEIHNLRILKGLINEELLADLSRIAGVSWIERERNNRALQ